MVCARSQMITKLLTLPDIKARIISQLQKYNAELRSPGGPLGGLQLVQHRAKDSNYRIQERVLYSYKP